jgi:hypothetical protein
MLKDLIRDTKPEIIVSIQDDYLDHVEVASSNGLSNEPLARFVNLVWQWHDDKGNWASIEVLGAIDDAPDGNFDIATLDYFFVDTIPHFSDDTLSEENRRELHEMMDECAAGFNPLHDGFIAE